MISLDNFQELQRRVEKAKQLRDQARGKLSVLKERLEKEYGKKTVEEGSALLTKLAAKERKQSEEYEKVKKSFEEHYSKLI